MAKTVIRLAAEEDIPAIIADCEPAVKKLQEEYGYNYTIQETK